MKKYNFDVYEKENGEAPFLEYLDSLDVKSRAKILRAITIVEDFGVHSPPGYIDHLDDGIYELRVKFSSNIFRCLYFHFTNNKYIITHGFTKKTQKTPAREITKSKEYRKDYLERKGEKDGK